MANADAITFMSLADGTLLQRHPDGAFRPVVAESDRAKLAALTEDEVERMSATDLDHPGLDDAFWERAASPPTQEAVSIKLDSDVLQYFRKAGRGYQARINAVLRNHMRAAGKGR
ncbi:MULTISPECIES: BrnA antitoxin family protein [Methylobacterium]|uniref:BrnA antitoxin family protein n=1 Tax=Methylobacterium TaxID=407 RepID=UPI0011C6F8C5|nr:MULTISPECIES: BrnA antitoxin family protein [Methylobacterium]TXN39763.1 BrnA antitoxin family protein [Methylobacterium sp. WL7]TXN57895.1 BrnA antitoxin family protein [Methylobacterium sp. WL18]GJE23899.1 hypothetical protein JHFBIEKO_4363 [Methylobacterium mesophilicum]